MESELNWITHKVSTEHEAALIQGSGKNWLICTPEALTICHSAPPYELSSNTFNVTSPDVPPPWF